MVVPDKQPLHNSSVEGSTRIKQHLHNISVEENTRKITIERVSMDSSQNKTIKFKLMIMKSPPVQSITFK